MTLGSIGPSGSPVFVETAAPAPSAQPAPATPTPAQVAEPAPGRTPAPQAVQQGARARAAALSPALQQALDRTIQNPLLNEVLENTQARLDAEERAGRARPQPQAQPQTQPQTRPAPATQTAPARTPPVPPTTTPTVPAPAAAAAAAAAPSTVARVAGAVVRGLASPFTAAAQYALTPSPTNAGHDEAVRRMNAEHEAGRRAARNAMPQIADLPPYTEADVDNLIERDPARWTGPTEAQPDHPWEGLAPTDPANHDPNRYAYVVHGTDLEQYMNQDPGFADRTVLSGSLVTQDVRGTFLGTGFIVDPPASNVVATYQTDARTMQNSIVRGDDIERARAQHGVHHPRDLLAATGTVREADGVLASEGRNAWNEVYMQGRTPGGEVRPTGVFAVTSRDLRVQGLRSAEEVQAANPGASAEDARRAFTAYRVAQRHNLPFVQLRPPS